MSVEQEAARGLRSFGYLRCSLNAETVGPFAWFRSIRSNHHRRVGPPKWKTSKSTKVFVIAASSTGLILSGRRRRQKPRSPGSTVECWNCPPHAPPPPCRPTSATCRQSPRPRPHPPACPPLSLTEGSRDPRPHPRAGDTPRRLSTRGAQLLRRHAGEGRRHTPGTIVLTRRRGEGDMCRVLDQRNRIASPPPPTPPFSSSVGHPILRSSCALFPFRRFRSNEKIATTPASSCPPNHRTPQRKVQRVVMDRLFWPDPQFMEVPGPQEPWVVDLRGRVEEALEAAIVPIKVSMGQSLFGAEGQGDGLPSSFGYGRRCLFYLVPRNAGAPHFPVPISKKE